VKKLRPALGSPCAGIANSIELNELNGEDLNRGTLHYLRGSWGLRSSVLSRIGLWEVPSIKRSSQWEKLSGHLTRGPNPQVGRCTQEWGVTMSWRGRKSWRIALV